MKDNSEYKVFYVNSSTGERVAFQHAIPVRFNREQAEQFIKDLSFDRWYAGGTPLPKEWSVEAIKFEPDPNLCCLCHKNPVDTAATEIGVGLELNSLH